MQTGQEKKMMKNRPRLVLRKRELPYICPLYPPAPVVGRGEEKNTKEIRKAGAGGRLGVTLTPSRKTRSRNERPIGEGGKPNAERHRVVKPEDARSTASEFIRDDVTLSMIRKIQRWSRSGRSGPPIKKGREGNHGSYSTTVGIAFAPKELER